MTQFSHLVKGLIQSQSCMRHRVTVFNPGELENSYHLPRCLLLCYEKISVGYFFFWLRKNKDETTGWIKTNNMVIAIQSPDFFFWQIAQFVLTLGFPRSFFFKRSHQSLVNWISQISDSKFLCAAKIVIKRFGFKNATISSHFPSCRRSIAN